MPVLEILLHHDFGYRKHLRFAMQGTVISFASSARATRTWMGDNERVLSSVPVLKRVSKLDMLFYAVPRSKERGATDQGQGKRGRSSSG